MSDGVSAAEDRRALITLAHGVEPGDGGVGRLVQRLGPGSALRRIVEGVARLPHLDGITSRLGAIDPDEADDRAAQVGARIVTRADHEWPGQLGDLGEREPFALWVVGAADLRLLALRSVAIVGARACTAYGEELARSWAAELATEAWCVLSGGAFGIDAAAHRGALAAGGATVCVLAGGVDVPYPRAHEALISRIADDGLVISETPPGESVRRQRFLSRNRVIAALSRATLVIEAAERSGTTATARSAHRMSRPVLAVPGPVTSPASAGCHRMIRDQEAILVSSASDVMDLLDFARAEGAATREVDNARAAERDRDRLSPRERTVLDALPGRGRLLLDGVARSAGLPLGDVAAALGILEVEGWVDAEPGGWRILRRT